ncbi:MAG: hypothetical protein AB9861_10270 [Methanosarcina sp.]
MRDTCTVINEPNAIGVSCSSNWEPEKQHADEQLGDAFNNILAEHLIR